MDYAESKFLIYKCWDTKQEGASTISGSLLLDCAMTQQECEEKIKMYMERVAYYNLYNKDTTHRYVSIPNQREWWP